MDSTNINSVFVHIHNTIVIGVMLITSLIIGLDELNSDGNSSVILLFFTLVLVCGIILLFQVLKINKKQMV